MHSNQYTLIFTSVLTIILASLLSVAAGSLNQIQKLNVEIDSKKNIQSSLGFKESEDEKISITSPRIAVIDILYDLLSEYSSYEIKIIES